MSSGSDDFNDDSPQSGSHKQFKFTISNGVVTQVHEFKDGSYESKSIDADDIYTVGANGVVEHRELKLLGTEITRYADADSDGVYNRISEQWIGSRFVLRMISSTHQLMVMISLPFVVVKIVMVGRDLMIL